MKTLIAAATAALMFAVPAWSVATDNVRSSHISGTTQVTVYATGLTPGGAYTPEWKVYKNDDDTTPAFTYFRSPVTADQSGYLASSVPLQLLSDYNDNYVPYVTEMVLLQPDANGFLKPVYDAAGHEYCTRVDVYEYGPQDNCDS